MRFMRTTNQDGFSLVELMISLLMLLVVMGAAFSLFSVTVNQHDTEQSGVEVMQEGRSALELMTLEIQQAGSHGGDIATTSAGTVSPQVNAQSLTVNSASGLSVGDYVDVGVGIENEVIKLTAVGSSSISGIFRRTHASGVPIRLFAKPFLAGVVPPAGLGANSSTTTTALHFFGDVNGNHTTNYVAYVYDSANAQITRSFTPVTQGSMNAALPFISNVKANSVGFTLYTDALGIVTSVKVALTVRNPRPTASHYAETALSSRIGIPSAVAASALLKENQLYGGVNQFPPTPANVTSWASQ